MKYLLFFLFAAFCAQSFAQVPVSRKVESFVIMQTAKSGNPKYWTAVNKDYWCKQIYKLSSPWDKRDYKLIEITYSLENHINELFECEGYLAEALLPSLPQFYFFSFSKELTYGCRKIEASCSSAQRQ